MLNHDGGVNTAKEMLDSIFNVLQRHTLINKTRGREEFYTIEMRAGERMQL